MNDRIVLNLGKTLSPTSPIKNNWTPHHDAEDKILSTCILQLAEDKILSTCILQNLDKALAKLRRGKDQVNMEVNENAEPGQAGVGKERNAATPVSRIGEAWDFVNMGIEVETTTKVELPLPPGWATHEQQGPEAEITITDSVNYSKEEKAESSPLEKLQARLCQSKLSRQPRKSIKKLVKKQAILDSGATSTFMRAQDGAIPTGERSTKRVQLPDGRAIQASEKAKLPWTKLRDKARECDILPSLKHNSLVSVGKLADAGYYTLFMPGGKGVKVYDANDVKINISAEAVLRGWRDHQGLWRVPIDDEEEVFLNDKELSEAAHNVFDLPSIEHTIRYLHASIGFPTKSTWLKAIKKGNFIGWPMATAENVAKYFPQSEETAKGHMNHQRQGVRSTKPKQPTPEPQEPDATQDVGKKERDVYSKIVDLWDMKGTIYTDQTGKFPVKARSGARYIMIMVAIDSNAVLAATLKNKSDKEQRLAYLALLKRLKQAGVVVKKHVMDNECSDKMKELIKSECMLELAPPGCHRRNLAEIGIKLFKNHFLSIMSGVDKSFPTYLWDKLLPQAELTLNLLRQSNATPSVSAHAHLFGNFDYNRMPLAPMGCAVQIHEDADKRGSWSPHTVDGWYLGTSPDHYRSHIIHVKGTKADRISETVFFKHKYLTNPTVTHADKVVNAARALCEALSRKKQGMQNHTMESLKKLSDIFLTTAKSNKDSSWEEPSKSNSREEPPKTTPQQPVISQQVHTPLSRLAVSLANTEKAHPLEQDTPVLQHASQPEPDPPEITPLKRVAREVRALNSTNIIGNNDSPARNTRSRCASIAALTLLAASNASGPQWTPQSMYNEASPLSPLAELAGAVLEGENVLKYRQLINHPTLGPTWRKSSSNEFGRLAQGVGGRIKGTETIFFVKREDIPQDRMQDVTYAQFVCNIRPEKEEKHRTRCVVGGNKINYPGDVGTPTADMLLVKILFNSIISTEGAKFMTADIKNFYLMTPLKRWEYIKLRLSDIPDEIVKEYNLKEIATKDGSIYVEVRRGMYGLPQAGLLAQEQLIVNLKEHGYYQSKLVPGLWHHKTRPITFTLVVDDFGVKYTNKRDADHLMTVLKQHYAITEDWKGERYIGMHLRWDYKGKKVHLAMPGYVEKALKEFHHELPRRRQDSPYTCTPKKYGAGAQVTEAPEEFEDLDAAGKKFIQQVTGKFLYLGRAIDGTLLTPLSALASQQSSPNEGTMNRTNHLLDYIATQEDAVLTYHASDMVLAVHSDAGYNNMPKARSRAGGLFFMSNNEDIPPPNGAVLNIAQIIKAVMSSAAEAELGALFINAKEATYIRIILEEMGHHQPPTPVQTDNSTANGVVNNTIQPKQMKAMDMRFHLLRDRMNQLQFRFHWRPGPTNRADYWTKFHPAAHHKKIRREILTPVQLVEKLFRSGDNLLRGCVKPRGGS